MKEDVMENMKENMVKKEEMNYIKEDLTNNRIGDMNIKLNNINNDLTYKITKEK